MWHSAQHLLVKKLLHEYRQRWDLCGLDGKNEGGESEGKEGVRMSPRFLW